MNEADSRVLARVAMRQMLQAAASVADPRAIEDSPSLGTLPTIDEILAANTLELAFGQDPQSIVARDTFRGFFLLASRGFPFCDPQVIEKQHGRTIRANYPNTSEEFIGLATTYWTMKEIHGELFLNQVSGAVADLFGWLDLNVGALFFPTGGPSSIDGQARLRAMKRMLFLVGSPLDPDRFAGKSRVANTGVTDAPEWIRRSPVNPPMNWMYVLGLLFFLGGLARIPYALPNAIRAAEAAELGGVLFQVAGFMGALGIGWELMRHFGVRRP